VPRISNHKLDYLQGSSTPLVRDTAAAVCAVCLCIVGTTARS